MVHENQNTTIFETTGEKDEELKENLLKRKTTLKTLDPASKEKSKKGGCVGHDKTADELGTRYHSNKL